MFYYCCDHPYYKCSITAVIIPIINVLYWFGKCASIIEREKVKRLNHYDAHVARLYTKCNFDISGNSI